jgi:hypothetical protein
MVKNEDPMLVVGVMKSSFQAVCGEVFNEGQFLSYVILVIVHHAVVKCFLVTDPSI